MMASEADAAAGTTTTTADDEMTTTNKKKKNRHEANIITMTKRQRRRHITNNDNNKHAWPQHPRITDMQQRNTAYLRAAGLLQQRTNDDETTKKKDEQQQQDDETEASQLLSTEQQTFGKCLGSADARVRHATVLKLKTYLRQKSNPSSNNGGGLSELDLLKLWKCLWYTLYMADRVPVQEELCKVLSFQLLFALQGTDEEDEYAAAAYMELMGDNYEEEKEEDDDGSSDDEDIVMEELENTLEHNENESGSDNEESESDDDEEEDEDESEVDVEEKQVALLMQQEEEENEEDEMNNSTVGHCRGAHLAALFVRTFFRTVLREWTNMDKYRIDKFYVVMRYMMNAVYTYMAERQWNIGIVRLFNDAIYEEVLSQTPNGVRYHLIDVCLPELAQVATEKAPLPLNEATILDVLEPFFAMAQTGAGGDDTVQARVVENVLEKFLDEYSLFSEQRDDDPDDDKEKSSSSTTIILDQVHVGTISQFIFEIASDEGIKSTTYRKKLYDLYKKYARRIQQVGPEHDVALNDDDDDDDGDDDDEEENKQGTGSEQDERGKDGNSKEVNVEDDSDDSKEVEKSSPAPVVAKKEVLEETLDDDDDDDEGGGDSSDEEEPPKAAVLKKKSKKLPKKKATKKVVKKKGEILKGSAPQIPTQKGKKKDAKASDRSIDKPKEEEITISIAEQKAAKRALKEKEKNNKDFDSVFDTHPSHKSKKKRKQEAAEAKREAKETRQKRVKFGDTNRSRSWTASMKNLRTMETPISGTTPERSILLNKANKPKQAPKKRLSRKKAADYFWGD